MAVALGAMVVALGGSGVAANLGNFILGTTNDATRVTQLNSNALTTTLKLVNTGSGVKSTPLTLEAGAGKPPLQVNSSQKVVNLNADLLDGRNSLDFSRAKVTAIAQERFFSSTSTDGSDTYSFGSVVVNAKLPSTCQVATTTQISGLSAAGEGPYYRNAVKIGIDAPFNENFYGLYFDSYGSGSQPSQSRVSLFNIPANVDTSFGVFLGSPPVSFQGKGTATIINVICYATDGLPPIQGNINTLSASRATSNAANTRTN